MLKLLEYVDYIGIKLMLGNRQCLQDPTCEHIYAITLCDQCWVFNSPLERNLGVLALAVVDADATRDPARVPTWVHHRRFSHLNARSVV